MSERGPDEGVPESGRRPDRGDPIVGRILDDRYEVGARIARGGMATVYAGTDTRLDRPVAIKVMHPNLVDDTTFAARFKREAIAAAKLAHQNVVAVYDQGDDNETLYLVMEHVRGITLRDLIRDQAPLPPGRAMFVLEPVLAALSAAHAAGMIHRDVKPENVLLADDGRIKVADFGLARAINAETQHTNTGVLIGTVSYLCPELIVAGTSDARADVYSSGVLLYEMLTGQKPHQAETPIQVAYKHVHEDVPAPSSVIPALPPYVDLLVARACARDPEQRPADAGELLELVRRVHSDLDRGLGRDLALEGELALTSRRDPFRDTDAMPKAILDPSDTADDWEPITGSDADGFYDQEAEHPVGGLAALGALGAAPRPGPARDTGVEMTTDLRRPAGGGPPSSRVPARDDYDDGPNRRGPLMLLGLVGIAVLVALSAWYFGFARYTTTPAVINTTQAQAEKKISDAGLSFKVAGKRYSETILEGRVLSTDPKGGDRIAKNGTVSVILSLGPERHAVPRMVGMTLDRAQQALQDSNLSYGGKTLRFSETVPKGDVIRSTPKAGTELRRNAPVDLVVSKGRKPIPLPDLTGKTKAQAQKALKGLGLKVAFGTPVYDDKVAANRVSSQDPKAGKKAFKGDTITLVMSKGPHLVDVPNVIGAGVKDARATLENAGFAVSVQKSPNYIGLRYVLEQSPASGQAPYGSTITIYLV